LIAFALAAALLTTPAQRVEAETLRPGTVVGGALVPAGARTTVSSPAPTRLRIRVRAVGCDGTLRVNARRLRVARGGWRALTLPLLTGEQILTLRSGRCPVRVDRLDVDWTPAPSSTWQWQLSGALDTSVPAQVHDVDLFETPASTVRALQAGGARVICYFSAGSRDRGRYPPRTLGEPLEGWPGERWLDIRRLDLLGPIVERRLDLCARKGFDGAEPDNVDGYANDSGFPLTAAQQLRFNRFIAREAHARGLSVGLKNDLDQVRALEPHFDWALNEQCFQYDECDRLRPFTRAGKAVFVAEYELATDAFCDAARAAGLMAMRKRLELDSWRQPCW
jgi:hypothetical protein